jgi:hypothetical protein
MAASHQSAWAVPDGIHCPDLEEPSPQGAHSSGNLDDCAWITGKPEVMPAHWQIARKRVYRFYCRLANFRAASYSKIDRYRRPVSAAVSERVVLR